MQDRLFDEVYEELDDFFVQVSRCVLDYETHLFVPVRERQNALLNQGHVQLHVELTLALQIKENLVEQSLREIFTGQLLYDHNDDIDVRHYLREGFWRHC